RAGNLPILQRHSPGPEILSLFQSLLCRVPCIYISDRLRFGRILLYLPESAPPRPPLQTYPQVPRPANQFQKQARFPFHRCLSAATQKIPPGINKLLFAQFSFYCFNLCIRNSLKSTDNSSFLSAKSTVAFKYPNLSPASNLLPLIK